MKKEFKQLMKVLPDRTKDRTIMILADQELVAFKEPRQEIKIKKVRCVQCGECCLDVEENHTPFGTNGEGKCNMLDTTGDKWKCLAGYKKPFSCLSDPLKANTPSCTIEYF